MAGVKHDYNKGMTKNHYNNYYCIHDSPLRVNIHQNIGLNRYNLDKYVVVVVVIGKFIFCTEDYALCDSIFCKQTSCGTATSTR